MAIGKLVSKAVRLIEKKVVTVPLKSSGWLKAGEKVEIKGLSLAKPKVDGFANSDYSLSPEFLDSLLEMKGNKKEIFAQIKDKMLCAMGYKKTELVKLKNSDTGRCDLLLDFRDGSITHSQKNISKPNAIAVIRHELDHLDKFAKLVKAEGIDTVEQAYNKGISKTGLDVSVKLDRNFWAEFSKDADINNFDAKKYLNALENYRFGLVQNSNSSSMYNMSLAKNLYCTNELEKSAYSIQKKVLKHFGEDSTTVYDVYGDKFDKIKNLLLKYQKDKELYIPKGFLGANSFEQLYTFHLGMSDPKGVKNLKYIKDVYNGIEAKDNDKIITCLKELNEVGEKVTSGTLSKVFDNIYYSLKKEKFTLGHMLEELI